MSGLSLALVQLETIYTSKVCSHGISSPVLQNKTMGILSVRFAEAPKPMCVFQNFLRFIKKKKATQSLSFLLPISWSF